MVAANLGLHRDPASAAMLKPDDVADALPAERDDPLATERNPEPSILNSVRSGQDE